MLKAGKKICALRDKKKEIFYLLYCPKKNSERNKKPYPPPCKLNGRSLSWSE